MGLVVGDEQVRLGRALEAPVPDVADDAHDLHGAEAVGSVLHEQLLAHGIAVGEALPRESPADHGHRRAALAVVVAERAAGDEPDPHGLGSTAA